MSDDWIDELLVSPTLAEQRSRVRQGAPEDGVLKAILEAMETNGGKRTRAGLALAVGQSPLSLTGVLVGLSRLLNVEGYPILRVHEGPFLSA